MIAKIWATVFAFPQKFAAILMFLFAKKMRKPSTMMSRKIKIDTKNQGVNFKKAKQKKVVVVRTLSVIGSKTWPKSVTTFHFRAKKPSSQSVRLAQMKIAKAAKKSEKFCEFEFAKK